MSNLFSTFDPNVFILFTVISINWFSVITILLMLPQLYWLAGSQVTATYAFIINILINELKSIFGANAHHGLLFIYIFMLFYILFSNFIGLFPYVFTGTRHIIFTVVLSLPVWVGRNIFSMFYQYNKIFAHLVPNGTPFILIPLIVIIETVRNIIRPGTLAIRLAANIIAGHLLLTLLGTNITVSSLLPFMVLMCLLFLLLLLELAVACIQSYVFIILGSLYINELSNLVLSKKTI